MSANLAALLYLVSGALFIMALRGLSSPATSRQGNIYGMVGMTIAMVTTLATMELSPMVIGLTVLGLAIGGGIGAYAAKNIAMTAMPQLVAAFHSLVGLAAVFVAAAAFYAPDAFHIVANGAIQPLSRIEMSLGAAIGALTFTGSIIAFLKLDGRMSGAPIMLPGAPCHQHRAGRGARRLHRAVLHEPHLAVVLGDHRHQPGAGLPADHPDRRR